MNAFIEAFEAGLSPIPVDTATKRPKVAWKTFQTTPADLLQCQEWEGQNIGVVCGAVSGRLVCLDFETGFMDQMPELVERLKAAGCYETFYGWVGGYSEETARGGLHVLVRLEGSGPTEGNRKLAMASPTEVLIETRGEGGYVVVAPSRNGTRGWTMLHGGFDRIAYATLEEWSAVVAVLETFDTTAPPPPPPTVSSPSTPSILRLGNSWIDDELARLPNIRTVLSSMGWEPDGRHDQYGEHWVRPGKDSRLGHSASISAADRLYVHSTNAGLPTGNPTLDKLDVLMAPELGRRPSIDERTEYLRRNAQRPPAELAGAGATPAVRVAELNLPASFWESRPYLAHVHQAALAQGLSPDALWEAIKCFYAASIPWNHRLPRDGTMDYISLIVGNSGAGKSSAKQEAYNLLSDLWGMDGVVFPVPPGSGEGMVEFFLDRSADNDRKYRFRGVGFYLDEGGWLLDIANRSGSTTVQILKQAWSGELTGSVAATSERHRWLAPRDVRATVLVSVTPDVAADFMRRDLSDGGLPQRVSWGWAHYPHPDVAPAHPGPLHVHPWATTGGGVVPLDLEPELAAMISARQLAASRGEEIDGLEGHATYATLKCASILAHLDGRLRVTMADWALAAQDWESSRRIRQYLLASQQRASQDRNVAAGVARAHSRIAETNVYLERAVHSLVAKARRSKEGLSRRDIKDHLRPFRQRHGIDHRDVLEMAIDRGLLSEEGGIVHHA